MCIRDSPVLERLRGLELDAMTPLEAFDHLRRLIGELGEAE